jgi:hypothetical protein
MFTVAAFGLAAAGALELVAELLPVLPDELDGAQAAARVRTTARIPTCSRAAEKRGQFMIGVRVYLPIGNGSKSLC